MHPHLESLLNEGENRYLKAEELTVLSQYVNSLPTRLSTYQMLRDHELEVMQQVANQLQTDMPQEKIENLERAIKNALLILRYCAVGMLLNNESLIRDRMNSWLGKTIGFYENQAINATLYRLLNQRLSQVLGAQSMSLLAPHLALAQSLMREPTPEPVVATVK
jgi:hypothetical protein